MTPREIPRECSPAMRAGDPDRPWTPVAVPHLTHMVTRNEPPLTRTPMWTLDELCEKVHVSRETVHTWRKGGTAPKAYVIGRHLLFEESDVRAWLEDRTAPVDEEPGASFWLGLVIPMAHEKLKPGEHGEIFINQTSSGSHQARVRVRLLDGTETQISRSRKTRASARLAVQVEVDDRLKRPKGSIDLRHDSKVGLAARQWIDELRVQATWPQPRRRPQTIDEYERLLGTLMVPKLGRLRLDELTTARCQAWIDGIIEAGRKGPNDMVVTAAQARMALKAVLDRAIVHDALRSNPMDKTTTPRRKQPNPAALTTADVYRLRTAVRTWCRRRGGVRLLAALLSRGSGLG